MATDTLVENLERDGAKLIEQLSHDGFEVTAAFWLQASESGKLYFYIASPVVEKEGLAPAYRRLHTAIRRMPQPFRIDPMTVTLIGENDRLTKTAVKYRSLPANIATRYNLNEFGGVGVESVFIYPEDISTWIKANGW